MTDISKNQSKMLKGIAIFFMLSLHLFNTTNYTDLYNDYSRVIAPVVADLCTTPVALSAPPNSFQNNSQS